ncbi:pyridoxamine 5'-phosphate oxidase family protein [Streptomyces natalensis]|uniref:pyridoxamine 5'-phosphate oxidase family protein n=1 Tax=Streptomyces natalensis TaxID=68242 RepID=UPI003B8314B9
MQLDLVDRRDDGGQLVVVLGEDLSPQVRAVSVHLSYEGQRRDELDGDFDVGAPVLFVPCVGDGLADLEGAFRGVFRNPSGWGRGWDRTFVAGVADAGVGGASIGASDWRVAKRSSCWVTGSSLTAVDSHSSGPRSPEQRKREALERLARDNDVWGATADATGGPCLVPLAFWWDGEAAWLSTRDTNPTGRNLYASIRVRLSFGHGRDVVLVHGTAHADPRGASGRGGRCLRRQGWLGPSQRPSFV